VAGKFPLYTDADISGPVVEALQKAGWDVLRAVDAHPEATEDPVHFEHAAREGRVLVSNDRRFEGLARTSLEQGKSFRGMICWPQTHYARMSAGDFLEAFEELARQYDPFVYPIVHIKPKK
jgi:hypothetical protein